MDPTNNPTLRSWIPVPPDSHFPIQNLPFGAFCRGDNDVPEIGVAIGENVVSLNVLAEAGLLDEGGSKIGRFCFDQQLDLNVFLMYGPKAWRAVRARLSDLLRHDNARLRDDADLRKRALLNQADVVMEVPADIRNYTDFYSSRHHATNVGIIMRRPRQCLAAQLAALARRLPRPGQFNHHQRHGHPSPAGPDQGRRCTAPTFGPSRNLDFELEMGFLVGPENELGEPIPIDQARDYIFGMVLVNDWSIATSRNGNTSRSARSLARASVRRYPLGW